jgi:hypothetical protein
MANFPQIFVWQVLDNDVCEAFWSHSLQAKSLQHLPKKLDTKSHLLLD